MPLSRILLVSFYQKMEVVKLKFQKCFAIVSCCLFIPFFLLSSSPQKTITLKDIYKTGKVEFFPVMKISEESVTGNILFKKVSSICWIQNRLYVLDTDCSNIKMFTTDGQFLKFFGKEGSRESELNVPYRMNVIDGQLVVWEARTSRFSIFSAHGDFKHTLQPFDKVFIENFASLGNGNIVIEKIKFGSVGDDCYNLIVIELYSKHLQFIKELYRKQILNSRVIKTPGKESHYILLPFQPEVSWHVLPGNNGKNTNKIVIGCSENYIINIIDAETGVNNTFSHPYSPVKINEADREQYFNSMLQKDEKGNYTLHRAEQFVIDNTVFPGEKPVFKRLFADYEGNILVFTYTDSDNGKFPKSASEFDAFDSDGKFINHVKIANGNEIHLMRLFSMKNRIFWGQSSSTGIPVGITKYVVN